MQVSPLLRRDLPSDIDVNSVDEVFELYGGMGTRSGNTVLLRSQGRWQAFTRTTLYGPLVLVKLAEGEAIRLRIEGYKRELAISTADSQTYVFDVPMFDQERAQKCFMPPAAKTAGPAVAAAPVPMTAPASGLSVATASLAASTTLAAEKQFANGNDSVLEAEVRKLLPDSKILAIKLWRERTGVGLKEAKDAVEALAAGRPVESAMSAPSAPKISKQGKNRKAKSSSNQAKPVAKEAQAVVQRAAPLPPPQASKAPIWLVLLIIISAFCAGIMMAAHK